FRELKKDLENKGHSFRTNSDTEVIVHLYEEYGKDLVHHLRGMFAIAVWDIKNKRLLVARDRLGIKPLFYSVVGKNVIFGSEMKSILASGLVSRDMNHQAVDAYFTYTYIPAPLTIYKDINKLEPGNLMIIDSL
ncbi:MAG: asparagine synthetase B, partial [Proteobacteria bacterium]|nr:asparagine synthetase B [Pseudomonadota bacterium]